LNVLYTASVSEVSMPETQRIDEYGGNMIGVHVKAPVTNIIAMFPTSADNTLYYGTISYSYSTTDPFIKHYLFGLPPNTDYGIIDTGSTIKFVPGGGPYRSSSQGVLIYRRGVPGQPEYPKDIRVTP